MSQQDFISLGLDVSQFNDAKKKRLQEFIVLFEKLSKYDGAKITPIFGDGITAFNQSLANTRYLLDDINDSIKKMNSAKITLKIPKVKAEDVVPEKEISDKIDKIDNKIGNIGKSLTRGLSLLRSIAYILPGIGIAGIFDAAFTAIGDAVHGLGLFVNKEQMAYDKTQLLEKSMKDLNEVMKDVAKNAAYANDEIVKAFESQTLIDKARGLSQGKLLTEGLKDTNFALGTNRIGRSENPQQTLEMVNDELFQSQVRLSAIKADITQVLVTAQQKFEDLEKNSGFDAVSILQLEEQASKKMEVKTQRLKDDYDKEKQIYDVLKSTREDYLKLTQKHLEQESELERYNSDQKRKLETETEKEILATQINANKIKLADDRNLYNAQIFLIEEKKEKAVAAADNTLAGVIGTKENPNLQFDKDTAEYKIAVKKNLEEIIRANQEADNEIEKKKIEFYQRRLKALTEINKDEINQIAIKSEKIANNEEHSLEERLAAYNRYLAGKQLFQDREFAIDIQKGASEFGGKTSLTTEEQKKLDTDRLTEQYNIQADAEKKVYEIVYSSLKKELDTVLNFNHQIDDANKAAYAKELRENNERFKNNIFQFKAFKENYDAINKKYGVILSEDDNEKQNKQDIKSAISEIDSLKKRRIDAEKEVNASKEQLDLSKEARKGENATDNEVLNSERVYDENIGIRNAYDKAIEEAEKKLRDAQKKGDDDEIKNAKAKYEQLQQLRKEASDNERKIIEQLFGLVKKNIDEEAKRRLEILQLKQKTIDEGYEGEINAIDKSSLSAKDKTALDIQLNEEKLESDKAAAVEERKIKQETARHDREITIAEIIWNTEKGISEALSYPPPFDTVLAVQRGILGAIAVATVLATPLPSYEEGTDWHPGGLARTGEKGKPELIKEPNKSPYWVTRDNISYLPEGTQVIPFKEAVLDSKISSTSDNMDGFRFLARQMKKNTPQVKTTNIIRVDLGNEQYKRKILGN